MNIFILDKCPIKSAEMLWADNKKRAMKMIIESCQLLSNTLHYFEIEAPYKKSHLNHPASVWVRKHHKSFSWLVAHCSALLDIYKSVYKKQHKCDDVLNFICYQHKNKNIKNKFELEYFDNFYNGAKNKKLNLDFTHIQDVNLAYRKYLQTRKLINL